MTMRFASNQLDYLALEVENPTITASDCGPAFSAQRSHLAPDTVAVHGDIDLDGRLLFGSFAHKHAVEFTRISHTLHTLIHENEYKGAPQLRTPVR